MGGSLGKASWGKWSVGGGTRVLKVAAEDADGTRVPSSQSKSLKQGRDRQTDRHRTNKYINANNKWLEKRLGR